MYDVLSRISQNLFNSFSSLDNNGSWVWPNDHSWWYLFIVSCRNVLEPVSCLLFWHHIGHSSWYFPSLLGSATVAFSTHLSSVCKQLCRSEIWQQALLRLDSSGNLVPQSDYQSVKRFGPQFVSSFFSSCQRLCIQAEWLSIYRNYVDELARYPISVLIPQVRLW